MKSNVFDLLLKIIIFVMCIILFITMNAYLTIYNITKIITKDNVITFVKEVDTESILLRNNIATESLYEVADQNHIDRALVEEILKSDELNNLIANYFGSLIDFMIHGVSSIYLSSNEIVDIAEEVLARKMSEFGYDMTNDQKDVFMNEVEKVAQEISSVFPNYKELTQDFNQNEIDIIRTFFSKELRYTLLLLIAIIISMIAIASHSTYRFALWTGVTTVLASIIYIIIGLLLKIAYYFIPNSGELDFVMIFLRNHISSVILMTGVITLCIGIVQIVYYKLVKQTSGTTTF